MGKIFNCSIEELAKHILEDPELYNSLKYSLKKLSEKELLSEDSKLYLNETMDFIEQANKIAKKC
jgi:hypothetical protein